MWKVAPVIARTGVTAAVERGAASRQSPRRRGRGAAPRQSHRRRGRGAAPRLAAVSAIGVSSSVATYTVGGIQDGR